MVRQHKIRLALALPALLLVMLPVRLLAQGDPNETPLGDVARSLRNKKTPPSQGVIDDDNFSQVMNQAESRHAQSAALKFQMTGESKGFQISAPDVTCSLSFTANAKTLLSTQYAQMELPPSEMEKLEGPATIEGDALTVTLMNGTDWHVSEVAVALMVVRKNEPRDASLSDGLMPSGASYGTAKFLPAASTNLQESEVRPEKKPDVTVIYRMRAAAPPFARTVFSAPLNLDLVPGEEWHWSIVQAKGYPPQSYSGNASQTAAQNNQTVPVQPVVPSSLLVPQDSDAVPLPQIPQ